MLGLSFDALWKTLKMGKDSILIPTEVGEFTAVSGTCFKIGQSAIVCNGITDIKLEKGMYLVGIHLPPPSRAQFAFRTSEGTELRYVSSCRYLSGINFVEVFPDLQEISMLVPTASSSSITSIVPATMVIVPVKWEDPSKVAKMDFSIKNASNNSPIGAYISNLVDFPVPHVTGVFQIISSPLSPNGGSDTIKIEMDATGFKGLFWGIISNGNGYCQNSVKVCNSNFSQCYEVYYNKYYNNSLNVHGLDQILLPFEDKLNLEFCSTNRNNRNTTRCSFNIFHFIAYGAPKS